VPSDEALEILENECVALAEELKKTLIEKTEAIEQRTQQEATPTNSALQVSVQELSTRTAAQKKQLSECEKMNSGGIKKKAAPADHALAADKITLDKALCVVERAGRKRKKACREAILDLENGTNTIKNELIDIIGLDEDGYYDQLFVD